jgi:hypothetical protein
MRGDKEKRSRISMTRRRGRKTNEELGERRREEMWSLHLLS